LQGFRINLERKVIAGLALHHFEHFSGGVFGLNPMRIKPLLEFFHLTAELYVELNVAGEAGIGEIAGANEGGRANYRQLAVRDVGLCVEFLLDVHTALNLSASNGLNDLFQPGQEVVLLLFALNAVVQQLADTRKTFNQCTLSTLGYLVTHQDTDLIQLLPLAVKGQQGTDFKVPGGNVKFV
jgi:hypothetical protein